MRDDEPGGIASRRLEVARRLLDLAESEVCLRGNLRRDWLCGSARSIDWSKGCSTQRNS
jgi:hypothetical protein